MGDVCEMDGRQHLNRRFPTSHVFDPLKVRVEVDSLRTRLHLRRPSQYRRATLVQLLGSLDSYAAALNVGRSIFAAATALLHCRERRSKLKRVRSKGGR